MIASTLRSAPRSDLLKFTVLLAAVAVHVPMGILFYQISVLSVIHPIAVLVIGLYLAVRKSESLSKVSAVAGYLIGAEVLWRMTRSPVFWEFGKYGTALIMVIALARRSRWQIPKLPLLYFVLLVPACVLTVVNNSGLQTRDKLSSNMSGPLLLFVSCWFFSHVSLNATALKRILTAVLIPLISVASVSLFFTATIENIEFTSESNYITSGFFGPNQVSSMLGLGVFLCLAQVLLFKTSFQELLFFGILALLFATQSVLTFSRGGMYGAVGATLAIVIYQFVNFSAGPKKTIAIVGIALVFLLVIFPFIDDFTGGKLLARFEDTSTTGRADIIESEVRMFFENPVLGAGVGEAKESRAEFIDLVAASHTEFSRLISEHGIFGVFALIALGLGLFLSYEKQAKGLGKALLVGSAVWTTVYMFTAGMRLAAPAFVLGLAFASIAVPRIRRINGPKVTGPAGSTQVERPRPVRKDPWKSRVRRA